MNILVCVKRVPDTGARMEIAAGEKAIETRNLGFTISPHEECGVEEAVRIIEKLGGSATVLTLGPPDVEDQLRDSMARGIDRAILLETDGSEWDPAQTASAIVEAIRAKQSQGERFDLFLFGNESADSGDYQVGIRVAHALDLPCVTGNQAAGGSRGKGSCQKRKRHRLGSLRSDAAGGADRERRFKPA